jgi:hypothetical protein
MASKIPPHLARELQRHVAKKVMPSQAASSQQKSKYSQSSPVLLGCLGFLGAACSIPFVAMWWVGRLVDKEEGLSAAQVRRGAFNNSGSRDVGRDPKWDFEKGMYKKDKDYEEIFARDNPDKLEHGEEFLGRR